MDPPVPAPITGYLHSSLPTHSCCNMDFLGGKAGLPLAAATDSTATLNKLALATGGTEKSWYRCIFPFGIVSVVIGVAATCITFTINGPQMDIAKVVSVATLIFGVGLLVAAYVCWRAKRERQQRRQRQEPGPVEQGAQ
uniref:TM100 protein n=1 Tax=Pavo cristatus TaxID=9049 RepID=A0A8C9FQQ3_PAVCR